MEQRDVITLPCSNFNNGFIESTVKLALRWRHNDHAGVSNHQPHGCLLNRLFRRKSKKTSKLRVTGLCAGNSPGTGEFPAQMASYAENISIWWRHHEGMDELLHHTENNGRGYSSMPSFSLPVPVKGPRVVLLPDQHDCAKMRLWFSYVCACCGFRATHIIYTVKLLIWGASNTKT